MQFKRHNTLHVRWIWPGILIHIVALLLLIPPGFAQQKKRLVLMETMPVPLVLAHSKWCLDELKTLGHIPGETVDLIRFNMDGDRQKARDFLAKILSAKKPNLVLTNATLASQEAMPFLKRSNIPQLFFTVADPIGAGLISEADSPTNGHLTGSIYSLDQRTMIKNMLRLVGQLPMLKPLRFGIIHSSYPSSKSEVNHLMKASQSIEDIVFIPYQIQYQKVPQGVPEMLKQVKVGIEQLENRVDFWWEVAGPLGELYEFDQLFHQLSSHPVALSHTLDAVKHQGSLLYMSPDAEKYGREVATIAHAILTGTDPGTIPVTIPAAFLLAINLKTALKMNIVIPSDMFELAGRHIY